MAQSSSNYLLSIEQLAESWGKGVQAIYKAVQRGTLQNVYYLSKQEALRRGLSWGDGRGGHKNRFRPFIDPADPAIPLHIREVIYQAILPSPWGKTVSRPHCPASLSYRELSPGGPTPLPPSDHGSSDSFAILRPPLSEQDQGTGTPDPDMHPRRGSYRDPARTNNDPSFRFSDLSGVALAKTEEELELYIYSRAPEYQRKLVDKYLPLVKETDGMKVRELASYIEVRGLGIAVRSLMRARSKYRQYGIEGLLAGWGKNAGHTKINPEHLGHFKSLYLKEGAPSVHSCWVQVVGRFFSKKIPSPLRGEGQGGGDTLSHISKEDIPTPGAFLYQIEKCMPKDSIYLARYGREKWNRKYASYIERDYSNILPGECWVSDHAQIDVAVFIPSPLRGEGKGGGDTKKSHSVCFPWVTVFRDLKSGKWLGWMLHAEGPNSDHIFQAFYWSALEHGLPKYIYIDNGKDYRCRDFAGTRRSHKLDVEENRAKTMLGSLGIEAIFALPYNAQAKTVERDFLKNKEWFSKQMPGYRGGHVKERPEKLVDEIKAGEILELKEFEVLFDKFVRQVLNLAPSAGKNLNGMCPDELWNMDYPGAIRPTEEALALFCMRTSKDVAIRRNGIKCPFSHEFYWAEWMVARKGEKVRLRQDPRKMQKAWVFLSATDEFLGTAELALKVPAIAKTDIEKQYVREAMRKKRQREKITKDYIEVMNIPPEERMDDMAAGVHLINFMRGYDSDEDRNPVNSIIQLANTEMDKVVMDEKRAEEQDTGDLSPFFGPEKPKRVIYDWEYEKEEAEQLASIKI